MQIPKELEILFMYQSQKMGDIFIKSKGNLKSWVYGFLTINNLQ